MADTAPARLDVAEDLAERLIRAGVATAVEDGFPATLQVLVTTRECAVAPIAVPMDRASHAEWDAALTEWVTQLRPAEEGSRVRQIVLRDRRIQVVIDIGPDTDAVDVVSRIREYLFPDTREVNCDILP